MFESKGRRGRVMLLCAAIADADTVRKQAIERTLTRVAERLETDVGAVSVSPVLWDFRSRFMLVAELPYQRDDAFPRIASLVFSLSELDELKVLAAAVDCDLLLPVADVQVARELASTIVAGQAADSRSANPTSPIPVSARYP
jgi:hypothetical protein